MGRAQKYRRRPRHLYALLFDNGCCYVGQTVNLRTRELQHRKLWPASFNQIHLATIEGTQAEAEDYEYAWRYRAGQAGWRVLAQNRMGETFAVNHNHRMDKHRRRLLRHCTWPREHALRMSLPNSWWTWFAVGLLVWLLFALK